jgi:uncharacterized protein (TIGR02217 family)
MADIVINPRWGYTREISFNTVAQETASHQADVFVPLAASPVWRYQWELPILTGRIDDPASGIASIVGLFCALRGRAGTFLFNDPRDNTVTNARFGTGDGSSKTFQLVRNLGNFFDEQVQNVNGTPHIYVDGAETFLYSLDTKGVITFDTAPSNTKPLTWSGNFYFRLRFKNDDLQVKNFFEGAWSSDFELESVNR